MLDEPTEGSSGRSC